MKSPALDAARDYLRRGWSPIPVVFQGKRPIAGEDWASFRLTESNLADHFGGPRKNVGIVLGSASGGLIDVDLDHPLAVELAPLFLPPTAAVFGRASKPASHWLYQVDEIDSESFSFNNDGMLVEIRAERHQTVFPGSVHESGEPIIWNTEGEPSECDADNLRTQVAMLAATVLLIVRFPAKGARDVVALALAGTLLKAGVTVEQAERYVQLVSERGGCDDVEAKVKKVRRTARVIERGKAVAGIAQLRRHLGKDIAERVVEWLGLREERSSPPNSECTDAANGERLVRSYQDSILYCYPWRAWHVWTGERWAKDDSGAIERFAVQTAKNVFGEAREAEGRKQKKLSKWAVTSQSKARLDAMIWAARSLVAVNPDHYDRNPWVLNVQNGTLELQEGILREFNRDDKISKQGGLEYDAEAQCPKWLGFLDRVTGGDAKMVGFLQRAVGYTLTGETSEQCFFMLHGEGANGKSTFIEVLRRVLGSYGRPTEFKTLVDGNRSDGVRNDLAALQGLRLVTAVEVNRGKKFDEALIKQLTGGDQITARFLYGEFFDFHPNFKLWLAVNYEPEIRGVDEGIWRRVNLIPFEVTIPPEERVKDLARILLDEEGPAIMSWAVEGCLAWQRTGLSAPERVKEATQTYRNESDALGDFVGAHVEVRAGGYVSSADLYQIYEKWCQDNATDPWKKNTFGHAMKERGYQSEYKSHDGHYGRYYHGIVLRKAESESVELGDAAEPEFVRRIECGPGHPSRRIE